ncbi:MAG: sulfatase-like hydrolase/transferase [bacterium]
MFNIFLFIQPLLISSYAVLFTYLSAIGEVSFWEFFITYFIVLLFSLFLIFLFKFIYKNFSKATLFSSILLLFFWSVTPLSRTLYAVKFFDIQIFRLRYLIPVVVFFLFILFIRLFKSKKQNYLLSTLLFYPYLALNLFCVFNIVKEKIEINKLIKKLELNSVAPQTGLCDGYSFVPRAAPLCGLHWANKFHPFHGLSNKKTYSIYKEQYDVIENGTAFNQFAVVDKLSNLSDYNDLQDREAHSPVFNEFAVVDKLSNVFDKTSKRSAIFSPVQAAKRRSSVLEKKHKLSPAAGRHINPDIYFIVLDTYLSNEALKQNFNFDNKEFLDNLQKKGFEVFNNSYSNYPETVSSLSSTLNMNYHENVKSGDIQQFFGLGFYKNKNNIVSKFLKSQGYKIINIPSVWGHVPKNNYANVDYYSKFPKRFFAKLLEHMSIMSPFVYLYIGYNSRTVFFDQLKIIEKHIKDLSPKFIFAHILCPHAPFVFDENGGNTNSADWLNDKKLYLGQLKFVNKKINELIDKILQQSSNPPIIILQADHGLNAGIMFSDYSKINEIDKEKLIKCFGILNAVYYPDLNHLDEPFDKLPPSPINNFRLLFNNYFGTNFELLKDQSFIGPDSNGQFVKIEKLRG